jgi:hypothetical protein
LSLLAGSCSLIGNESADAFMPSDSDSPLRYPDDADATPDAVASPRLPVGSVLHVYVGAVLPAGPVNPVEPVEPVEPLEPLEPLEPIDAVESSDPRKPLEPTEPLDRIEPIEPIAPIESDESGDPQEPLEPVEHIEPTKPTKHRESVDISSAEIVSDLDVGSGTTIDGEVYLVRNAGSETGSTLDAWPDPGAVADDHMPAAGASLESGERYVVAIRVHITEADLDLAITAVMLTLSTGERVRIPFAFMYCTGPADSTASADPECGFTDEDTTNATKAAERRAQ